MAPPLNNRWKETLTECLRQASLTIRPAKGGTTLCTLASPLHLESDSIDAKNI